MEAEIRLVQRLKSELNKVRFDAVWPDFKREPYALYNKNGVWLEDGRIDWDERFMGNTSIRFNDGFLAIWRVDSPADQDAEELAAGLAHEMFHAYQMSNGWASFPNDLEALDYPYEAVNLQMKSLENQYLVKGLEEQDEMKKRCCLQRFIGLRKKREALINSAIKNEYLAETVEGSAEYAGLMALRQINNEKHLNKLEQYKSKLKNPGSLLFDARRMSYYAGALLIMLALELGYRGIYACGAGSETVFERIADSIEGIEPDDIEPEDWLKAAVRDHEKWLEGRFNDFFKLPRERICGRFEICGYDPMNMVKRGDRIICDHFIMLCGIPNGDKQLLHGPVVVELEKGAASRVVSYYI